MGQHTSRNALLNLATISHMKLGFLRKKEPSGGMLTVIGLETLFMVPLSFTLLMDLPTLFPLLLENKSSYSVTLNLFS